MTTIDQQFIEYIVKSLVGKPDEVKIDRRVDDLGVLLELTVDPEDLGRVIGKRGATAQSLRTLLRALGTKNDERYNLKIIDNGAPRPPRDDAGVPANNNDSTSSDDSVAPAANDVPTDDAPADDSQASTDDEPAASIGDGWGNTAVPDPKPSASDDLDLDDDDTSSGDSSDKLSKTRKELSEFDDLDI